MGLLKKSKTGGFMDEIRCDEPSYLIWKWHPRDAVSGLNNRENAVRWGSSLRVKDGEVAVFVYKQKDGTVQDYIVGPADEKISTKNLPIIASIIGLAYDGGTPFQAEIYFINLAQIIQVNFGVPFFDVYDPRFLDFGVPVAVRGTLSFNIADYKEFIKLHRLNTFNLEDFQMQIRDAISKYIKNIVANLPASQNIPLVQIETKTSLINDLAGNDITKRLKENFGVNVTGVDIGAIELDKTSEGYQQLMSVTRDVSAAKVKAETEDYTERIRIQREEGQYAMHKQTQSANLGAFQVEKQAEVGVAGAEALGQMGENGAGSVNLDGGGTGFNPAAMMAGMTIGGAMGQNIAGAMNNSFNQANNPNVQTPPPVPSNAYSVAVNGQATGPYDLNLLQQMVQNGQFNGESLVWKAGMQNWEKAADVDELKPILTSIPPVPPPINN